MSVFEISSTAHRSDKRSFALNRAHLRGVQAPIPGVLGAILGPAAKFLKNQIFRVIKNYNNKSII